MSIIELLTNLKIVNTHIFVFYFGTNWLQSFLCPYLSSNSIKTGLGPQLNVNFWPDIFISLQHKLRQKFLWFPVYLVCLQIFPSFDSLNVLYIIFPCVCLLQLFFDFLFQPGWNISTSTCFKIWDPFLLLILFILSSIDKNFLMGRSQQLYFISKEKCFVWIPNRLCFRESKLFYSFSSSA